MVKTPQSGKPIDISIMPSFECNLKCSFCMYNAGPDNKEILSLYKTKRFLKTVDWSQINWCGFYGGEPSINMPLYDKFVELVPKSIKKFVITNGTWSLDEYATIRFLRWCVRKFHIIISSTPEHVKYQNRPFLEILSHNYPDEIVLKEPDEIHAQGRAKYLIDVKSYCQFACRRTDRNMRLGLKPNGDIVYQNCHGEYIVVQTYKDKFDGIYERAKNLQVKCLSTKQLIVKEDNHE
jgi:hypothetical protein